MKPVLISLLDSQIMDPNYDTEMEVEGVINLKTSPISNYKVSMAYGDIKLIICMLHDYIKGLDEIKKDSIDWEAYYRDKFQGIADHLSEQIEYDYNKALAKCIKNRDKYEVEGSPGEDALIMAMKKGMTANQKKEAGIEKDEEQQRDRSPGDNAGDSDRSDSN